MTYYGQRDTDKYIEKYFPNKKNGLCIEVGAYDGVKGSNTKLFEDKGWGTLCIEPNPHIFSLLQQNRSGICVEVACDNYIGSSDLEIFDFNSGVQSSLTSLNVDERLVLEYADAIQARHKTIVSVTTLNFILASHNISHIDFISIDTEGTELNVLEGLDLIIHKPTLLVVENNYCDKNITQHLENNGYKFTERYFVNDFYIRKKA